ncbi:hypothetical protein Pisl_0746 [Pyrobaculum islandicum DSM 4184]|uniref:Uncharacterized protein n=2 Tax=Pyrobaculum islandicum TaxID=2277 RepID=A1RSJ1_PYRIL|nr:hypothetical protein Pisl_0746 [Pyrobaculum islandicum DSM 4184]
MKLKIIRAMTLIIGIAVGALLGGYAAPKPALTTVVSTVTQSSVVTQTSVQTVTQTLVQTTTVAPPVPRLSAADVELRRSVGSLMGRYFLSQFPTVAVVAQPNVLYGALASASLAALPSYSRGYLVLYNATLPEASAARAAGAAAVFLAFGGEEAPAVVDRSMRDFLAALAKTNFTGALVVNGRAFAATDRFRTVLNDTRISGWVKARPVYVVSANATHVTVSRLNVTTGALAPVLVADRETGEAVRRYTDSDSLFLRSAVGRVAGGVLFKGYGRVAIVTGTDPACAALTGAAFASSRANSTRIIVYTGDGGALAREIAEYRPDAVFIAFGGDMPSYAISQATRGVLAALASANYTGDVLLHAFVLRATNLLATALDDKTAQWLSQRTIKGIVPDLANRRVNIVVFAVADGRLRPVNVTTTLPMPEAVAQALAKILS